MAASSITLADGRDAGDMRGILDPLDRALARGIVTGWKECAEVIQEEVVRRAPVDTGNLRDTFASPDAIQETAQHHWRFGLLTDEMQRRAHYWIYVEYGTPPHPAKVRGYINPRTGRRVRKTRPAAMGRPAQPFVRPGIIAGRRRHYAIMSKVLAIAVGFAFRMQHMAQPMSRFWALQLRDIDRKINEDER